MARPQKTSQVRADGTLVCADASGSIHRIGAHVRAWMLQWLGRSGSSNCPAGALVPIDVLRQRLRAELV